MRLKNYRCTELQITTAMPFSKISWKKMTQLLRLKTGRAVREGDKIQVMVEPNEKASDYHFHVSARRIKERKTSDVLVSVEIYANQNFRMIRRSRAMDKSGGLDSWMRTLSEDCGTAKELKLSCRARLSYPSSRFSPVLPMPFRGAFGVKDQDGFFDGVSISGVKMEVQKSSVGIGTIYFEVFPEFIGVGIVFYQKTAIGTGFFENLLEDINKLARILVVEKEGTHAGK